MWCQKCQYFLEEDSCPTHKEILWNDGGIFNDNGLFLNEKLLRNVLFCKGKTVFYWDQNLKDYLHFSQDVDCIFEKFACFWLFAYLKFACL